MPEKINLPQTDVEGTIRAAGDSEDLIRRLVHEENRSEEIYNTIKRNIDHLKIILGKQEIIDSQSIRLQGFTEAVTLGENFTNVGIATT